MDLNPDLDKRMSLAESGNYFFSVAFLKINGDCPVPDFGDYLKFYLHSRNGHVPSDYVCAVNDNTFLVVLQGNILQNYNGEMYQGRASQVLEDFIREMMLCADRGKKRFVINAGLAEYVKGKGLSKIYDEAREKMRTSSYESSFAEPVKPKKVILPVDFEQDTADVA